MKYFIVLSLCFVVWNAKISAGEIGISTEGFEGKLESISTSSKEGSEAAKIAWELLLKRLPSTEYWAFLEKYDLQVWNYKYGNAGKLMSRNKEGSLVPAIYGSDFFLKLKLVPRLELELSEDDDSVEYHDLTVHTDYDGFISLFKHTQYKAGSASRRLVTPKTDSKEAFRIIYFNATPRGTVTFENKEKDLPLRFTEGDFVAFQRTSYIKAEQGVKPREQFAALASEFKNYQYVYVPYSHQLLSAKKKVGLHHSEGLLALSRYPILTHSVLRLTRDFNDSSDTMQRVCVQLLIDTPNGSINVFVASLSNSPEAEMRTTQEILRFTDEFNLDVPQILVLENLTSNGSKVLTGETTVGNKKGKFQATQHSQVLLRKGYHPGNLLEVEELENIKGSSQERGVAKPVNSQALVLKEKRSTKEEL